MKKKIKEIWVEFQKLVLWIAIIAVLGAIIWVIAGGLDNKQPSLYGYYSGRTITIYSYKLNTSEEYAYVAWHEWAHSVYDRKLSGQDLKEWVNLSRKCGISTAYAKKFKSKSIRVSEDFAESYATYKTGGELCQEKKLFLARWQ